MKTASLGITKDAMFLCVSKVGSFKSFSMAETLLIKEYSLRMYLLGHFQLMNRLLLTGAPDCGKVVQ